MWKVKVGLHSWNLPGRNAEKHEGHKTVDVRGEIRTGSIPKYK
jgi:hypothetical protein